MKSNSTGERFVLAAPEGLGYDGDGNLVRDGRWVYSWDAENRLVRVMSYGATDRASWRRVDWAYDALGRRTRQTTYVLSNGVWVVTEDLKFVSDPVWFGRHIAELNATNHALVRSYVWGLDLSGMLGSAGGVGGLVWVTQHSGSSAVVYFCAYDGNGNVAALVHAPSSMPHAHYEYGPFGEPLRTTGPAAAFNPFRFSTKRTDPATGLVLYEYRAYSPGLGRWLSRDPIGEWGGVNLQNFVAHRPIQWIDAWGLAYGGNRADFREKRDCICRCGISNCAKGAALAEQALSETRNRFPGSTMHNDKADAWRHCYWSCEMTRQLGTQAAKCIGDVHEEANERRGQPPVERAMDEYNNSVGRSVATENGSCAGLCEKALNEGKLRVLE